jgi:hypothetical protein
MPDYHVPEVPEGEFEFCGLRIVANPDVPEGMVEIHDEDGRLERRFDWRRDFERWHREQT